MTQKRSSAITQGFERTPHRALLKGDRCPTKGDGQTFYRYSLVLY